MTTKTVCPEGKGRHRWGHGTTCLTCGMTRGRLAAMYDDRNVATRAVNAERERLAKALTGESMHNLWTLSGRVDPFGGDGDAWIAYATVLRAVLRIDA